MQATADIYNLFNSDGLLALNSSYGSLWRQGTGYSGGLIAARTVQVGGRLNF